MIGEQIDTSRLVISIRNDGQKEYAVIIRSDDSKGLKKQCIRLNSITGDVIVSRLTIDELEMIVKLNSVRSVGTGSKNFIQQQSM